MIDENGPGVSVRNIVEAINPFEEEIEASSEIARQIKPIAISYATEHGGKPWLLKVINSATSPDAIVSHMRHLDGGQIFILREILRISPKLRWFRGGDITNWRSNSGLSSGFSDQELNTIVLERGANGALGRPKLAESFLFKYHRTHPAIFSLGVSDLIDGLSDHSIKLVDEEAYDLKVVPADYHQYLAFCRNRLRVEPFQY